MCLVSPDMYRRLLKPRHRKLVDAIKSKTKAKVLMHSDGSIYPIIGDLIDIGVDALNPIQVSARQMDSDVLKREFGRHLCFWGAIDTHRVLPMGTPEDVETEVRKRIGDLAPGGGYVLTSVHNIQSEVPPENMMAMYNAARKWGTYPG
jgi:uroporphyrinogen decarboxylase